MFALDIVAAPVAAALGSLQRRIGDLSGPWEHVGAEAVDATMPLVPVLTGALVDTLKSAGGRDGVDVSAGGGLVDYARLQNARHHFMDRAADAVQEDAPREIESEIRSLIRLVGLD